MINVSDNFKDAIYSTHEYTLTCNVTFADGSTAVFDSTNLQKGGSKVTSGGGSGSLAIGVAICRELSLSIFNYDGEYDDIDFLDAEIYVRQSLKLEDGTSERIDIGKFYVSNPASYGETVEVKAYDKMVKASAVVFNITRTSYTMLQALTDACSQSGLSLLTSTGIANSSFALGEIPPGLTCREVIGYCAMLAGGNAVINGQGKVEIKTYDMSSVDAVTSYSDINRHSKIYNTFEDYNDVTVSKDPITITGVRFMLNNVAYQSGNDGYVIQLENELLTGRLKDAANAIGTILNGMTFKTFSLQNIRYPIAEICDPCIIVKTKLDEKILIKGVVTDIGYELNGYTEISCNAEQPVANSSLKYNSPATRAIFGLQEALSTERTARETAIEALNETVSAMGGLYETTETLADQSVIYYFHDKPDPHFNPHPTSPEDNESTLVIKIGGEAVGISLDGGVTWPYGLDFYNAEAILNNIYLYGGVEASHVHINHVPITTTIDNLQDQIDGSITTWTGTVEPTLSNYPASQWTTTAEKDKHIGDIYYVSNPNSDKDGFAYRFQNVNGTYSWALLKDSDVTKAIADAQQALEDVGAITDPVDGLLVTNYYTKTTTDSMFTASEAGILSTVGEQYTTIVEMQSTEANNLVPFPYRAGTDEHGTTNNGVTFVYSTTNYKITANGTATGGNAIYTFARFDPGILSSGKYTLSGGNETDSRSSKCLVAVQTDASGNNPTYFYADGEYEGGKKGQVTFDYDETKRLSLWAFVKNGSTVTNWVTLPMLEKGTFAHDYISYEDSVSGLSATVTTQGSSISALRQDLDGFETTVAQTYSTKTETNEAISEAETSLNSKIQQNADNITSTVTRVDALETRGNNLLRNSGTFKDWTLASSAEIKTGAQSKITYVEFGAVEEVTSRGMSNMTSGTDAKDDLLLIPYTEVRNSDPSDGKKRVTVSVYFQSPDYSSIDGTTNNRIRVALALVDSSKNAVKQRVLAPVVGGSAFPLSSSWERWSATVNLTDDWFNGGTGSGTINENDDYVVFRVYAETPYRVRVSRPQIEVGTLTDWSPMVSDQSMSIAESKIEQNATNISLKVSSSDFNGNEIVTRINLDSTTAEIKASRLAKITADKINLNGYATINDKFWVDLDGSFGATAGSVGGWTINSQNIARNTDVTSGTASTQYQTVINANAASGSSYAINIRERTYDGNDPTQDSSYGTWSSPNFSVAYDGSMTATKGKIANWTIDSNSLYTGTKDTGTGAGNITLRGSGTFTREIDGVSRASLRFAIGSKFAVNTNGVLYAADGVFSGTVSATSGNIGGISFSNNNLVVPATHIGTIDASSGKITNINADYITAGTLDANKVTVSNLDAGSITSGSISGRLVSVTGGLNVTSGSVAVTNGGLSAKTLAIDSGSGNYVHLFGLNATWLTLPAYADFNTAAKIGTALQGKVILVGSAY